MMIQQMSKLDELCKEIEVSWNQNRDASIVDRLAADYPKYSSELYAFFALVFENELSQADGVPLAGAFRSGKFAELARQERERAFNIYESVELETNDTPWFDEDFDDQ